MTKSQEAFRRDAVSLLVHMRLLDIQHIDRENEITDDDVQLIGDHESEDGWEGVFSIDDDAEKIWEVSYKHKNGRFYITEHIMYRCIVIDPDQILYSE